MSVFIVKRCQNWSNFLLLMSKLIKMSVFTVKMCQNWSNCLFLGSKFAISSQTGSVSRSNILFMIYHLLFELNWIELGLGLVEVLFAWLADPMSISSDLISHWMHERARNAQSNSRNCRSIVPSIDLSISLSLFRFRSPNSLSFIVHNHSLFGPLFFPSSCYSIFSQHFGFLQSTFRVLRSQLINISVFKVTIWHFSSQLIKISVFKFEISVFKVQIYDFTSQFIKISGFKVTIYQNFGF